MIRDPRGGHNRKAINEDFFKVWSPKMSYALGFLFADGSLLNTSKSSRTFYVSFTNNDLSLLEQMRSAMKSSHQIYIRPPRFMKPRGKQYLSKAGYVLRIGNRVMHQDLLNLGLEHRKSNIMHLPEVPDEYFSYFLRGYFDGDGCINTYLAKRRITVILTLLFTSGSVLFLSQLADRLHRLLNIDTPHYYKSTGAHNLECKGLKAVKILNYMYADLDKAPYLERKYLKYREYMDNQMGSRIKARLATFG